MHSASTRPRRLIEDHFRVTDAWCQAIPSNPATVACSERGKKGGAMIEASLLIRAPFFGALLPAHTPKISYPAESGIPRGQSHPRSCTATRHSTHEATSSIDNSLNGSRQPSRHQSTNVGVQSSRKHSRRHKAQDRSNFVLLSFDTLIHSGATDKDTDPG